MNKDVSKQRDDKLYKDEDSFFHWTKLCLASLALKSARTIMDDIRPLPT
ncbi:hypothetical protein K3495_g3527 [Podosphaera aphanis]|nr:hypothetical protein K3495_g3527 [Podosphaera aphanis]